MTLEEFEIELKKHDWYFMMSERQTVWDKGQQDQKRLVEIANNHGKEFIDLFNQYMKKGES